MSDYEEPTNEQLAKFLSIYAEHMPAFQAIRLDVGPVSPAILEKLLESRPEFREAGLRHHKAFYEDIVIYGKGVREGTLKCAHIRPNDKLCPNHNEPGSLYCGLHKALHEE